MLAHVPQFRVDSVFISHRRYQKRAVPICSGAVLVVPSRQHLQITIPMIFFLFICASIGNGIFSFKMYMIADEIDSRRA